MNKEIAKMSRTEVIFALRGVLNPKWYHDCIYWPTNILKAILGFYEIGGTDAELATFMPKPKMRVLEIELVEIHTDRRPCVDGIRRRT